jgi:hypothetical protein
MSSSIILDCLLEVTRQLETAAEEQGSEIE